MRCGVRLRWRAEWVAGRYLRLRGDAEGTRGRIRCCERVLSCLLFGRRCEKVERCCRWRTEGRGIGIQEGIGRGWCRRAAGLLGCLSVQLLVESNLVISMQPPRSSSATSTPVGLRSILAALLPLRSILESFFIEGIWSSRTWWGACVFS